MISFTICRQQSLTCTPQRRCPVFRESRRSFSDELITCLKHVIVHKAKLFKGFGKIAAEPDTPGINWIAHNCADGCRTPVGFPILCGNTPVVQPVGDSVGTPAFRCDFLEYLLSVCSTTLEVLKNKA